MEVLCEGRLQTIIDLHFNGLSFVLYQTNHRRNLLSERAQRFALYVERVLQCLTCRSIDNVKECTQKTNTYKITINK